MIHLDWKLALVTPIYKGNENKAYPSNYRPISIKAIVSNRFETAVKQQLVDFIGQFISDKQSSLSEWQVHTPDLHRIIEVMGKNPDYAHSI